MPRHVPLLAVVFALASVAVSANAAECTEDAASCGRREFDEGIKAFRAADYQAAAEHFKAAQDFRPHPVVLFNLALAESKLGRYVEALAHFDQVLSDPQLPADLKPKVEDERAKTDSAVATIELEVGEGSEAWVDDVKAEGTPAVARVNPGAHKVRVLDQGRTVLDRTVRLKTGERLRLAVDRTREVVVEPGTAKPGAPQADSAPSQGMSPVWFYAGAGLTAVLGGVTIWSGLDTQSAFDDYEKDLPKLSQAEVNQRVDDGHKKETRTNVLIAATSVAAVGTAALGLFVVDWRGRGGARAGLLVGPGSVHAVGSF